MAGFIDAYDTRTGIKVRVPEHYFEVPSLSRHLSLTPRQKAGDRRTKRRKASASAPVASIPSAPVEITEPPATGDDKE